MIDINPTKSVYLYVFKTHTKVIVLLIVVITHS